MSLLYSLRSFYSFRARVTNAIGNNIVSNCSQCFFHNCEAFFFFCCFFFSLSPPVLCLRFLSFLVHIFPLAFFPLLLSLCYYSLFPGKFSSCGHMCAESSKKFHVGLVAKRTGFVYLLMYALGARTCETNESFCVHTLPLLCLHNWCTHCQRQNKTWPKSFSKSNPIISVR